VFFLGLHGGAGEDGGLQGLCNVLNVPFTSSDVMGSAVGMDKVVSKYLCRDAGIPVVDFVAFREGEWSGCEEACLDRVEESLGYPVIVKPARLGSSIGIARADDRSELDEAIEEAFRYDDKVVIEDAVEQLREINCSVLGDVDDCRPSVLEQPVRTEGEELLTYEEKYMRGGSKSGKVRLGRKQRTDRAEGMASLDRMIPAPIPDAQRDEIHDLAVRLFALFECSGVVRIDFMIDDATGRVYFNEINTIPGSLSFYLWEPTGLSFPELVGSLIDVAIQRHRRKNGRIRSYDVNLLSERSLQGLKAAKA
jgi:D-alanine-D-alanine ligase